MLEMFANMLKHKSAWTMCFSGWHLWAYNTFNLKVQGKDKSVVDPHSAVKSFGSKLSLSTSDIYAAMVELFSASSYCEIKKKALLTTMSVPAYNNTN